MQAVRFTQDRKHPATEQKQSQEMGQPQLLEEITFCQLLPLLTNSYQVTNFFHYRSSIT